MVSDLAFNSTLFKLTSWDAGIAQDGVVQLLTVTVL